ncbi:hypothetical protein FACS189429_5090 [Bacteroidia bacterium]|nr:hypothetical protein FACS189429_5090 [Bacteroidia bacterium]
MCAASASAQTAVGSISGSFAVSPTGAATYTIPIEIPAGINGVQPNISLVYNSQGGNGVAGVGWGISGLSAISVMPRTIFSNNAVSGLNLDASNTDYALDGNRLVLSKESSNGHPVYSTENETFVRAVYSNGKFTVTTKDGTVMEYEQQIKPKPITGSNAANVTLQWALSKVTDASGNYMNYRYKNNPNGTQTVLEQIEYTGNGSTPPVLNIVFNYRPKAKVQKQYFGGHYLEDYFLLDNITVKCKAELLRKYSLSYSYTDEKDFLQWIELSNAAGETFPKTIITYGQDNKVLAVNKSAITNSGASHRTFSSGDYDGDGIADLIELYRKSDNSSNDHIQYDQWIKIYKLQRNSGNISSSETLYNAKLGQTDITQNHNITIGNAFLANFNGQKRTVIVPRYDDNNGKKVIFKDVKSGVELHRATLTHSSEIPAIAAGDLNNDGIDEIVFLEKGNGSGSWGKIMYVSKNSAGLGVEYILSSDPIVIDNFGFSINYEIKDLIVADMNADGLNDIMIITDRASYFLKNNGGFKGLDGIVRVSFTQVSSDSDIKWNTGLSRIKFGDFNGDGMIDVLRYDGHNDFTLHLNTGNFTFSHSTISNVSNWDDSFNAVREVERNDDKDDFVVVDFNHDGKSDIIVFDACYRNECAWYLLGGCMNPWMAYDHSKIQWFSSNGNGTFTLTKTETIYPTNNCPEEQYHLQGYFTTGDFDGDGREDLFSYKVDLLNQANNINTASDNGFFYAAFNNGFAANLVTNITDGMDVGTNISYQPLTFAKDFYTKATNATYPIVDIQAPLYCVRQTQTSWGSKDNGLGSSTNDYSYTGLKIHTQGRGLLGFIGQTVVNRESDIKTETGTDFDYNYCLPSKQKQKLTLTDGTQISGVENLFTNTKSDRIYTTLPAHTMEVDNLTTLTKLTRYDRYDDYGNLLQSTTVQGDLRTEQIIKYDTYGAWAWCNNKPTSQTVISTYTGVSPVSDIKRETTFDYDRCGRLKEQITDPSDRNRVKTEYMDFDSFGHPLTTQVTASMNRTDITQQSTVTFTSSGRFVATKTNVSGETTTYQWNESKGEMESENDHYGRSTKYNYDNWGRLQSTTYPDYTAKTVQLFWAAGVSDAPRSAKYYSHTTTSGNASVTVWYDQLRREMRRDTYGLNSKKICVATEYDALSRVYRVSDPYFWGDNIIWAKTCKYDEFGRPAIVTTPMGDMEYGYSELTTETRTPEGEKTTVLNRSGFAVQSITNRQSVAYTHNAAGQPLAVTPAGGQTVSMQYDLQGNRTLLADPDAGNVTTWYNGFGLIVQHAQSVHTNTPEVLTNYVYNSNGTLQYKTVNNARTDYIYDRPYRKHTVSNATHSQVFDYDSYDRVLYLTESIDGQNYRYGYHYSADGKMDEETFPSGYWVKYKYVNGIMCNATDSRNRNIWTLTELNAKGQIKQEIKGQVTTNYTYDSRSFPQTVKASGIIDYSYIFDGKGNLASRADNIYSQKEFLHYDDLNRLDGWGASNYASTSPPASFPFTNVYSPAEGNITQKTDIAADMHYGAPLARPRQLAQITGLTPDAAAQFAHNWTAEYTDFRKLAAMKEFDPQTAEETKKYTIAYGVDEQRRISNYYEYGNLKEKKIYFGHFENIFTNNGQNECKKNIHYLCGGAVLIQETGQPEQLLYGYSDCMGSLTALVNESGTAVERYAYDPWGRRRDPENWKAFDTRRTAYKLSRGYTMHEHLDHFSVINMNGRVYDPLTAQFFSPDPYIQAPDNWLNYNRYSYCLNNPFKYTDPSGEKWWLWVGLELLSGGLFSSTISQTITMFTVTGSAWSNTVALMRLPVEFDKGLDQFSRNMQLTFGLFARDNNKNKGFWGNLWKIFSRNTWESWQTQVGLGYNYWRNSFDYIDRVDYLGGATFATNENSSHHRGVTLGSYVSMDINGKIDRDFVEYVTQVDPMYMHEYGHTMDSRNYGFTYLFAVGLPSLNSVNKQTRTDEAPFDTHSSFWTETRANANAKSYFGKYYDVDWDRRYHPVGWEDGEWRKNADGNDYYYYYTLEDFYPTNF